MTTSIVLTRPFVGKTASTTPTSFQTSIINGQPTVTLADSTRGDKLLSIAEQIFVFTKNRLRDMEWIRVANTTDTSSGYVAEFDGTVCFATGQCENTNGNSKNIHLFINNTDRGSIGNLTSATVATFVNTAINIDYAQGDTIRLQAVGTDSIEDTVIKITIKHRA